MNEQQILELIKEKLREQTGEKSGGSGHLSHVSISDIKIERIEEATLQGKRRLRVQYSYTVDIVSEFAYADEPDPDSEPDPYDPYHHTKTGEIIIPL